MMISKMSFALLLGLAACTQATHEEVVATDGHSAYETTCSHSDDFSQCQQEAKSTCHGQYTVLGTEDREIAPPTKRSVAYAGAETSQDMVYRCSTTAH